MSLLPAWGNANIITLRSALGTPYGEWHCKLITHSLRLTLPINSTVNYDTCLNRIVNKSSLSFTITQEKCTIVVFWNIRFIKGRTQNMKNWVILVLLGVFLATTMAGCKKGGWGSSASCGAHVVRSEKTFQNDSSNSIENPVEPQETTLKISPA